MGKRTSPKLLKVFRRLVSGSETPLDTEIDGLLSSEAFEEQLVKERARADRSGASLTLLAFSIETPNNGVTKQKALRILASVLVERTRISDTKGWFGDRLGVILPDTSGAQTTSISHPIQETFNKRVHSKLGGRGPLPEVTHEVYVYPGEGNKAGLQEVRITRRRGSFVG
jgi:hypothetical protein